MKLRFNPIYAPAWIGLFLGLTFAFDPPVAVRIEIPAGTTDKIEFNPETGEFEVNRVIRYLPYPVNYGFVPNTLAGDGDPVDVLLLSRRVETGAHLDAIPLATLRLTDRGEPDEKVLFIPLEDSLRLTNCTTWACLQTHHADMIAQIETWFMHYKGPGVMESSGWMGTDSTRTFIRDAIID